MPPAAITFCSNGQVRTSISWSGQYIGDHAHGPGTLIDTDGCVWQCLLENGLLSGYYLVTHPNGNKDAAKCDAQGKTDGVEISFKNDGSIHICDNDRYLKGGEGKSPLAS